MPVKSRYMYVFNQKQMWPTIYEIWALDNPKLQ